MDKNNLKNIVVLKNLPSNIVDEAIIILKPNKKIKRLEVIDKKSNKKRENGNFKNNIHVINEAEMIVNNYIFEIEKNKSKTDGNDVFIEKYKRLKKYCLVSNLVLLMSIILHFF